jgi:histidyl-tRNA synthetase
LREYYSAHAGSLPKVDLDRLQRSPLRLLDSKEPESQALAEAAPRSVDYLSEASARRWQETLQLLDSLKTVYPDLTYAVDHRLVRGLDYYTHTVFEVEPEGAQGQSTLLGGGRYDGLMEVLGGLPTPGVGFAAGLERFILNLQKQRVDVDTAPSVDLVLVHMGEAAASRAVEVAAALRLRGVSAVVATAGRSLKAQMRFADSVSARYALIIGERELARGVGSLKTLSEGGEQTEVSLTPEAVAAEVAPRLS